MSLKEKRNYFVPLSFVITLNEIRLNDGNTKYIKFYIRYICPSKIIECDSKFNFPTF